MCTITDGVGIISKLNVFYCIDHAIKHAGAFTDHAGAFTDHAGAFTEQAGAFTDQAGAFTDHAGAFTDHAGAFTEQAGAFTDQAGAFTDHAGAFGCFHCKVHCSLPSPQNVTIVSFNLEHKLTWTPGPGTAAFTHFRVQSYNQKRKLWISVKSCSDVQIGESCDLTKSFKEMFGVYQARVQAFNQVQESNWTTSKFFTPLLDTTLGPPLVSLTGCGNCLLLKLSPPASVEQNHDPLTNFFQEYTVTVSRTRDKAQFGMKASNGENLINYLEPGVEYCITATAVTSFKNLALPSEPHCTYTSPQPFNTALRKGKKNPNKQTKKR
ncbi:interferon alpha/beta receptor 2 isoform X2 [Pangasianodon hypophthalmus]|uniref:interferon alpha/beta receptor 2 isoform X2 n=1 Tax=Pangasianodon hypophthalmus TaxID=310915 RepID=UPI00230743C3|nr:interferon alpha/beta receptor 2 isoform X2 [Pangasianodon hypophthalmus]